jgi:short-subunit dehydrogenase
MSTDGRLDAPPPLDGPIASDERSGKRTALITGAAGGIGLELSRLLAVDGYDVVLVGRDRERLERVRADVRARHRISVRWVSVDLSESRAAFQLWTHLTIAGLTIDVLINNAGVGLYGLLHEQDPAELDRMLQLNIATLTTLTRLVLPGMRQRHWGRVLTVASIVPYQPGGPRMTAYYASKAYVLSFSRGLARELDGSGVSITVLVPGPTKTSFDDRAGANLNVFYKRLPKMTAAAVARAGYDGMKRQSMVVIPGLMTRILELAGELPPRRIALEVNRLLWKPRPVRSSRTMTRGARSSLRRDLSDRLTMSLVGRGSPMIWKRYHGESHRPQTTPTARGSVRGES